MKNMLKGTTILITGGTGSWGQELTSQLLTFFDPREIRIYTRGEHAQVDMRRKFNDKRIRFIIGDVRDKERLSGAAAGVDYIFHLAALKHVPVCEENPWEAVRTNTVGTQNVIDVATTQNVKKVIYVSSDKAVDPFNVYGMTKAAGEKLIVAANQLTKTTKFVCIRAGNVIGTKGSFIPLFQEQIARYNEITITDKSMTRFLMRLQEAITLLLKAAIESVGGEILVMKMPASTVETVSTVVINRLGSKKTSMRSIGVRPGEKHHEVLVSRYEAPRTFDLGKYFVILPQLDLPETYKHYENKKATKVDFEEYNSKNAVMLDVKEVDSLLDLDGWFHDKEKEEIIAAHAKENNEKLQTFFKSEGWI